MTREEAIKGLKVLRRDFSGYKPNEEMFDMAIEALEQEPTAEYSSDVISREEVKNKLQRKTVKKGEKMSILIKGIEMPKEPWECPCHNGEDGRCNVTQKVCVEIPKDCPLVSAPPQLEQEEYCLRKAFEMKVFEFKKKIAEQEPKHGKWIDDDPINHKYHRCSCCGTGYFNWGSDVYCRNCGTRMESDEE